MWTDKVNFFTVTCNLMLNDFGWCYTCITEFHWTRNAKIYYLQVLCPTFRKKKNLKAAWRKLLILSGRRKIIWELASSHPKDAMWKRGVRAFLQVCSDVLDTAWAAAQKDSAASCILEESHASLCSPWLLTVIWKGKAGWRVGIGKWQNHKKMEEKKKGVQKRNICAAEKVCMKTNILGTFIVFHYHLEI